MVALPGKDACGAASGSKCQRPTREVFCIGARYPMHRRCPEALAIEGTQDAKRGL